MSTVSTWVAVLALILGYVAVVAAYFALRTLAKLRRATAVLARGARGPEAHASLIEATQRNTERIELVAEEIADLRALVANSTAASAAAGGRPSKDTPNAVGPGGLRNVALVRYDAFGEMSGRLSFSLALLDDEGDGVTISAIAGQSDTRVYAKGVASGKGEHELTPEEKQAVTSALGKKRLFSRSA